MLHWGAHATGRDKLALAGLAVFLSGTIAAPAADLHVPSQYPTIQAAIDAAWPGDVVIVADGVYTGEGNKWITFASKAITVRSANGPDNCIIDCEGDGRGFTFGGGATPDFVLEGFTITGGYVSDRGGAIRCNNGANPTIVNCTIIGNEAQYGGGVYSDSSSPTLTDCRIVGNYASDAVGGGIYSHDGSPTLIRCTISRNELAPYGHGWRAGAGICCSGGSSVITECTIADHAASLGAGLWCSGGSPVVTKCCFRNNVATVGGAIYCYNGVSLTLSNCLIRDNVAEEESGGIHFWAASATIVHCTFAHNGAVEGRAIGCDTWPDYPPTVVTIANSVLWNGGREIRVAGDSVVGVIRSDVYGGWPGEGNIDADPMFALSGDYHLDSASPCIDGGTADPPGGLLTDDLDGATRPLDGDDDQVALPDMGAYELDSGAPTIALSAPTLSFSADAGCANPPTQTLAISRCGGGVLDWSLTDDAAWLTATPAVGQSQGEVDTASVSADIVGLEPGTYTAVLTASAPQATNSPRSVIITLKVRRALHVPNEHATIQAAIDAAQDGDTDTVILADGVYTGDGNTDLDFNGKALIVRSENGPASCTIDCDGDGAAFDFDDGETPASVASGLTIVNGYSGIRCTSSSPTIEDCIIMNNAAIYSDGGGVNCRDYSSPVFMNCTITNNSAADKGGGVYCDDYCSPVFIDCQIVGNCTGGARGGNGGGGVHCSGDSDPTFINCTISGNATSSIQGGGGLHCFLDCRPTLVDCTIADNSSGWGGGIYCSAGCQPVLTRCAIAANTAAQAGGGIAVRYEYYGERATLASCLISGNQAPEGGAIDCGSAGVILLNCSVVQNEADTGSAINWVGSATTPVQVTDSILWNGGNEIGTDDPANVVISHSDVFGGWAGDGNINEDPLFVDPDGPDDDPDTWADNDFRLSAGSPCIDAGDNAAVTADLGDADQDGDIDEPIPFDLAGSKRFVDAPDVADTGSGTPPIVDMGAYEFSYPAGDLNCDGQVNLFDVDPFVLALADPDGYAAAYPECDGLLADANGDGVANLFDIDAFIALLTD